MQFTEKELALFWSKVKKSDECWTWAGAITLQGYGSASYRGTNCTAHRLSYMIEHGEITKGMVIMHTCDNRACVNPSHLIMGTQKENVHDMHRKGRWNNNPLWGVQIGTAKLTEQEVLDIRRRYQDHEANQYELAKQYGISQRTINQIVHKYTWKTAGQIRAPRISADPTMWQVDRICICCGSHFMRTVSIYATESESFCSQSCRAITRREGDAEQFWKNVDRSNPDSCWEWRGSMFRNGYGQSNLIIGKIRLAHRVAWILTSGDIPSGMLVLHRCDNRACINPSHLFLGTDKDNMQDMIAKGRLPHRNHRKGAASVLSIFTPDQIRAIRQRRSEGATLTQLVKEFHAGKTTIARIVRGEAYTEVT